MPKRSLQQLLDEMSAATMTPAEFRAWEAEYFLGCYQHASGPPKDNYPLMATYLDACLFSLVSIQDLGGERLRHELHESNLYCLLKALRNATTHWMVVGATNKDAKLKRPFSRHMTNGNVPGFDSSRLKLHLPWLKELLEQQAQRAMRRKDKRSGKSIIKAQEYVSELETQGAVVDIESLLRNAIAFASQNLLVNEVEPENVAVDSHRELE